MVLVGVAFSPRFACAYGVSLSGVVCALLVVGWPDNTVGGCGRTRHPVGTPGFHPWGAVLAPKGCGGFGVGGVPICGVTRWYEG